MITLLFTWGGTTSLVWYSGGQSSTHKENRAIPPETCITTMTYVPNVSNVPYPQHLPLANASQSDVPPVPNVSNVSSVSSVPSPQLLPLDNAQQRDVSPVPNVPGVPSVSSVPFPQSSPPAHSLQSDVPPISAIPGTDPAPSTLPPVPNVTSVSTVPNPAHSTSEVAQQPIETAPASRESVPKSNGTS